MIPIVSPFPQYFDLDGSPLDAGYVFFGAPDENPETSPVVVYWDAAGTQPAAQPIRTLNGYPVRNGSPAQIFAPVNYSYSVKNRRGILVYYIRQSTASAVQLSRLLVYTNSGGVQYVSINGGAPTTDGANIFSAIGGTMFADVEGTGGGGGSGGNPTTTVDQQVFTSGGGGGAFGIGRYLTPLINIPIVVGAAGAAGGLNSPGGAGGETSFGALLKVPGGNGSTQGFASGGIGGASGTSGGGLPTGANILGVRGGDSPNVISSALGFVGGQSGGPSGSGTPNGYGAGARGKFNGQGTAAPQPGIAGYPGLLIVREYTR